jgi:hypothetical protein
LIKTAARGARTKGTISAMTCDWPNSLNGTDKIQTRTMSLPRF